MIDHRIIEWIEDGGSINNLSLQVPGFLLIYFLKNKRVDSLIAFLIQDLVVQIKEGDRPTIDEIQAVSSFLITGETKKTNILDLPPRKKDDQN